MNSIVRRIVAAVCLAVPLVLTSTVRAQGPLTPPGAPVPTMKTLAQVEPRTPLSVAGFTITQPGSYYLTTNLTATGHGVVIAASRVTLDLMGFALTGDRGNSDSGIFLNGVTNMPLCDVTVRNGIVHNFYFGIYAKNIQGCRFDHLMVSSNALNGVYYYGAERLCDGNTLAHCVINGNGGPGVFINSGSVGRCDGNTLADCTIIGNASYGIYFSSSSGQCEGNLISGCTISKNAIRGIWLSSVNGNRVEGNHVSGQIGAFTHGIECSSTARNLILRNTCVGQTNNFTMSANDTYGPIVTGSGALSTTNGAAGLSPWANFSR